ncbi:acyl carrier protein [Amycolatopsis thermoflava]|uniref:acyl carrier protein n=1 Tax=Amycolatopsis thermoflava TaxID=84480 RepID=UPI0038296E5C
MTTMTREHARETVRTALAGFATDEDWAALSPGENFRDVLELDSLDFLTFVERLADATGKRIDESDYPRLTTVDGCVGFLVS